ncbi:hypothetical protein B0H16DRAFT_195189 [Mycena metata]|uniref:Cytochrome b561 domain-containing protein n=1 Tax=Mycena metata TaxID=1033252 RepID=A0AAD7JW03_9AGAR|nr:hypothetical protein B0H16DRAFT_195189 [Mycena metata]
MDPNAEDYELLLPTEQRLEAGGADGGVNMNKARQEDQMPGEGRRGDAVGKYTALTGAALFVAVTWVVILVNNPLNTGVFAFHPLLQSLSFLLFTYGILTLQPTSRPKTKTAGLARHQYTILLAAFPAIFFGTFAVMYNKYREGAVHFKSWHGKFGIACMAWLFVQILLGGGSVWFGGAAFGGGVKAKAIWKYHRVSGYVLYGLLTATAHLGSAWSNWGNKYCPQSMRILAYWAALVACLAGVYMRIRPSKMKF